METFSDTHSKYLKLEEFVFNHLMARHEQDGLTFSVRQKAGKKSELDYFIGTADSNYSAFSLWNIAVDSFVATDVIDFIFSEIEPNKFKIELQFVVSHNLESDQDKGTIKLGETIKKELKNRSIEFSSSKEGTKHFKFNSKLKSSEFEGHKNFLNGLDEYISTYSEIINKCLAEVKTSAPKYRAELVSKEEFDKSIQKLQKRREKYLGTMNMISNFPTEKMKKYPLNQILYGPPGTGKTYSTIDKVVQICEPEEYIKGGHEKNKVVYDRLVKDGRVFFTTFHQSMSYEDFIEGIKPIAPKKDTDPVQYEIEDGIFKLMCDQCLDEIKELKNQQYSLASDLTFKEKFAEFVRQIQAGIINLETRSGLLVRISKVSPSGNMRLITGEDTKDYIISANRLERLLQEIPNPDKVTNIHEAVRNAIGGSHSSLYFASLIAFKEFDKKYSKTIAEEGKQIDLADIRLAAEEIQSLPKYAIIIDEINRGNVSAIFGELITLIEEDKRFGYDDELILKLPYSKSDFVVPPNLYIIGTMNTADRSVEALDTALRRRFSFVEMMPKPALLKETIEGISIEKLLSTLNERIEVLVDRDHTIGHAFFINDTTLDNLRSTFANKVIPLLQEYFYGDYSKMEMVIGSAFFDVKETMKIKFAVRSDSFDPEGKVYHIRNVANKEVMSDEDFKAAVQQIMNTED